MVNEISGDSSFRPNQVCFFMQVSGGRDLVAEWEVSNPTMEQVLQWGARANAFNLLKNQ